MLELIDIWHFYTSWITSLQHSRRDLKPVAFLVFICFISKCWLSSILYFRKLWQNLVLVISNLQWFSLKYNPCLPLWFLSANSRTKIKSSDEIGVSNKHILWRLSTGAATGGALWKKVFLKISWNSQGDTCARVSFLIKLQA